MREQGTIAISKNGTWGFIQADSPARKVYWHLSAVRDGIVLHELDRVEFTAVPNQGGNSCKWKAADIRPIAAAAKGQTA
jgi:cold shock CspA family protein